MFQKKINKPQKLIRCEQRGIGQRQVALAIGLLKKNGISNKHVSWKGDAALRKEHEFGLFCSGNKTLKWKCLAGSSIPSWKKVEMTKLEIEGQTWTRAAIVGRGNGKVVTETGGTPSNAMSQQHRHRKFQTGGGH